MTQLQVLIIEEISMVENQFLERLNLLMQHLLNNQGPFGGKQVIFVVSVLNGPLKYAYHGFLVKLMRQP